MLSSPRIVAIDDIRRDLNALVRGLRRQGTSCLPIDFPDGLDTLRDCPNLRILFADLHLIVGANSRQRRSHYSTIGGILQEQIRPIGPYIVVLWTKYPNDANGLLRYLNSTLQDVAKPFTTFAMDKNKYFRGNGRVLMDALIRDLARLSEKVPEFAALMDWEDHINSGAGDTLMSILEVSMDEVRKDPRRRRMGALLYNLAMAAVGSGHVDENRFRAVNAALLPILADRTSFATSRVEDNVWAKALSSRNQNTAISNYDKARLNRLVHIASPDQYSRSEEPGAVIGLPSQFVGPAFEGLFSIAEEKALFDEFLCKADSDIGNRRWVLVQTQPACDYAQRQSGTLPFYLGLELAAEAVRGNAKAPDSLWRSPRYEWNGKECFLHVSARYPLSMARSSVAGVPQIYRIREQLLANLTQRLGVYASRLGIVALQ